MCTYSIFINRCAGTIVIFVCVTLTCLHLPEESFENNLTTAKCTWYCTPHLSLSHASRSVGLFVGCSAAMNCVGAVLAARRLGGGHKIVTVLCDSGNRGVSRSAMCARYSWWPRPCCYTWYSSKRFGTSIMQPRTRRVRYYEANRTSMQQCNYHHATCAWYSSLHCRSTPPPPVR